jgi:ATP-dependent Lon protease
MRDEAEIRGHRRTYIGAMPGQIVQGIRRAGTNNPVFMLDEIDKLGTDFRGDPSSALLEVLDPEQNNSFRDHYIDTPFDLSRVFFVTTANVLDTIPPPLRDRMEVIELGGYTEEEKVEIAKKHLIPKQIDEHGLKPRMLKWSVDSIRFLIRMYTREAGVRNLEREIASLCRKATRLFAEGRTKAVAVNSAFIEQSLAERKLKPGMAVGLAWTPTGGDVLFVEAAGMPGTGQLILTGQLGDVMKESARAALSYLRTHASEHRIDPEVFATTDIHVHVPAGSIPKDGPSAGITILTALASLFTNRPVNSRLAMTGELTLMGQVLPIGGVKEKVLAAYRAGIRSLVLCELNQKDFSEEVPDAIRRKLRVTWVDSADEVLRSALTKRPGAQLNGKLRRRPTNTTRRAAAARRRR